MDVNEMAARLLDEHGAAVETAGAPMWLQLRVEPWGELKSVVRTEPEGWLGHDLPFGWDAAGVVATGRVHAMDPHHELPASVAGARNGGLRLCCVVARDGAVGWKAQLPASASADRGRPGPPDPDPSHPLATAPEDGMMLDCLMRAVGRPTTPPTTPAGDLFILMWVEALLTASEVRDEIPGRARWRASWSDLVSLHPFVPLGPDRHPDEAESVLADFTSSMTWADLRERAITIGTSVLLPHAPLARWMDDGIFSRWVMASLPPLADALRVARPHLSSDAYHRLRRLARRRDRVDRRTYVR